MTNCLSRTLPALTFAGLIALGGCSHAAAGQGPILGTSRTLRVSGQYESVPLNRIESLALRSGTLVLTDGAASASVEVPVPAAADRPSRDWALITETDREGTRELTFIHAERLDEFTVTLPASEAPVRYQVFAGRGTEEVMVLAWGANGESRWGYVTIAAADGAR